MIERRRANQMTFLHIQKPQKALSHMLLWYRQGYYQLLSTIYHNKQYNSSPQTMQFITTTQFITTNSTTKQYYKQHNKTTQQNKAYS